MQYWPSHQHIFEPNSNGRFRHPPHFCSVERLNIELLCWKNHKYNYWDIVYSCFVPDEMLSEQRLPIHALIYVYSGEMMWRTRGGRWPSVRATTCSSNATIRWSCWNTRRTVRLKAISIRFEQGIVAIGREAHLRGRHEAAELVRMKEKAVRHAHLPAEKLKGFIIYNIVWWSTASCSGSAFSFIRFLTHIHLPPKKKATSLWAVKQLYMFVYFLNLPK